VSQNFKISLYTIITGQTREYLFVVARNDNLENSWSNLPFHWSLFRLEMFVVADFSM